MESYIDMTLFPDAEFPSTVLLNSLYSKLHKALYDLSSTSIGVSFPKYESTLGNVLRIHGTTKDLERLMSLKWVGAMNDYCNISKIERVPPNTTYRLFSRQQANMSQSKLRRLVKRGTLKPDNSKTYMTKMKERLIQAPYVELKSASTGQRYRRYIKIGEIIKDPKNGIFDHFGLSINATVPWF